MKGLLRNKQSFYYAQYVDKTPIVDEWGNNTGEWEVHYSPPTSATANISPAFGESNVWQFGENLTYDKVLVFTENLPINEYSRLWVDTDDIASSHDYIVKRVAKSLNSTSIAIAKVEVSNG